MFVPYYKIIKQLAKDTYLVQDEQNGTIRRRHVDDLILASNEASWHRRFDSFQPPPVKKRRPRYYNSLNKDPVQKDEPVATRTSLPRKAKLAIDTELPEQVIEQTLSDINEENEERAEDYIPPSPVLDISRSVPNSPPPSENDPSIDLDTSIPGRDLEDTRPERPAENRQTELATPRPYFLRSNRNKFDQAQSDKWTSNTPNRIQKRKKSSYQEEEKSKKQKKAADDDHPEDMELGMIQDGFIWDDFSFK
jgi:hypothetical protein